MPGHHIAFDSMGKIIVVPLKKDTVHSYEFLRRVSFLAQLFTTAGRLSVVNSCFGRLDGTGTVLMERGMKDIDNINISSLQFAIIRHT